MTKKTATQVTEEGAGEPRVVSGDELVPDLRAAPLEQEFWYWVGCTPACPLEGVTVAGISFPKVEEDVRRHPATGRTTRTPRSGALVRLSRRRLDLIAARLPSRVFRFVHGGPPDADKFERAGGQVLDSAREEEKRTALLLSIPSGDELEAYARRSQPWRRFVARAGDEPLANYVYCVPAPGAQRAAGEEIPRPLSVTGLRYPADGAKPDACAAPGG